MKFDLAALTGLFIFFGATSTSASALDKRACNADLCYRAIANSASLASHLADCSAYSTASVVPSYAAACSGSVRYVSACSCLGAPLTLKSSSTGPAVVGAGSTTSSPTQTTTQTITVTATSTFTVVSTTTAISTESASSTTTAVITVSTSTTTTSTAFDTVTSATTTTTTYTAVNNQNGEPAAQCTTFALMVTTPRYTNYFLEQSHGDVALTPYSSKAAFFTVNPSTYDYVLDIRDRDPDSVDPALANRASLVGTGLSNSILKPVALFTDASDNRYKCTVQPAAPSDGFSTIAGVFSCLDPGNNQPVHFLSYSDSTPSNGLFTTFLDPSTFSDGYVEVQFLAVNVCGIQ